MHDQQVDEQLFLIGDRCRFQINGLIQHAREFGMREEVCPNFLVVLRDCNQITNPPGLGIRPQGDGRKQQAADDPGAFEKGEPVLRDPLKQPPWG